MWTLVPLEVSTLLICESLYLLIHLSHFGAGVCFVISLLLQIYEELLIFSLLNFLLAVRAGVMAFKAPTCSSQSTTCFLVFSSRNGNQISKVLESMMNCFLGIIWGTN